MGLFFEDERADNLAIVANFLKTNKAKKRKLKAKLKALNVEREELLAFQKSLQEEK